MRQLMPPKTANQADLINRLDLTPPRWHDCGIKSSAARKFRAEPEHSSGERVVLPKIWYADKPHPRKSCSAWLRGKGSMDRTCQILFVLPPFQELCYQLSGRCVLFIRDNKTFHLLTACATPRSVSHEVGVGKGKTYV